MKRKRTSCQCRLPEEIIGHLQSATKELVEPCHIFFSKLCTEGTLHNWWKFVCSQNPMLSFLGLTFSSYLRNKDACIAHEVGPLVVVQRCPELLQLLLMVLNCFGFACLA
jgi:hypothetical protein